MKLVTVVGARPQFIKAAAGSRVLRREHREILVHTGQHFDSNMSDVFFRELGIPAPDYNLNISGGSHAQMTARMLTALEPVLLAEKPDAVLVYGDTNSTLAAALAAVKLLIPVIHVEAGNRLGTLNSPEEVNRIMTDHIATLNFCATDSALHCLQQEGLSHNSHLVGNIMYDSYRYFANQPWQSHTLPGLNGEAAVLPKRYYFMTCHRQENTQNDAALTEILTAMNSLDAPTVYPVHPRCRQQVQRIAESHRLHNLILLQPVGYSDSVHLTQNALKIVTDSGGLQCEAFYAGVQCLLVLDWVVWPETMVGNRNQLCKPNRAEILQKLATSQTVDPSYQPFGDGHAAEKIAAHLSRWESSRTREE